MRLFSTDLDGTVVGNPEATRRFARFWHSLPDDIRPVLVYNSGRLVDDQLALIDETGLPEPDFIIGGVGTMLHHKTNTSLSDNFSSAIADGFDSHSVERVMSGIDGIKRQPDEYQHALKSSWYLHDSTQDALTAIQQRLEHAGLQAQIVYSSSRDLDVLPRNANKGYAALWLAKSLGIAPSDIIVAGDTGNDRAMFEIPGVRGIIVANALEELRQLGNTNDRLMIAKLPMADGVIEGLTRLLAREP